MRHPGSVEHSAGRRSYEQEQPRERRGRNESHPRRSNKKKPQAERPKTIDWLHNSPRVSIRDAPYSPDSRRTVSGFQPFGSLSSNFNLAASQRSFFSLLAFSALE